MSDVEPPIPSRNPQPPAPPNTAPPLMLSKLPETAYRELKPGEVYTPMVPATLRAPEVTIRSIIVGVVMCVVFSAAATYVALKVGQGIETAIPISIVAIGVSGFIGMLGLRRSTLIENVNILAIATTSGIVAGGTVFTMPAIYILNLDKNLQMSWMQLFLQIFLVPFLGAVLGVLYLVPFRRYFVKQMHGKLPFPEATATNEILVTGAGGNIGQIMVLFYAFIVGFIYNGASQVLKLFTETFTTASIALHRVSDAAVATQARWHNFWFDLTHQTKAIFSLGTGAEFLGLGFIIGVRYASIILAGSFLSWFVIVPLLADLPIESMHLLNAGLTATTHLEGKPRAALPAQVVAALPAGTETAPAALSPALRQFFAERNLELDPNATVRAVEGKEEWTISAGAAGNRSRTYVVRRAGEGAELWAHDPQAGEIFRGIPRNIGIGCIFTAGIISILKMSGVIVTALRQAMGALFSGTGAGAEERTDHDINYPTLIGLGLVTAAAIWAYFYFVAMQGLDNGLRLSFISLVLALVVAFLFTTVSAWAIATISVTPISGMTVTTIIITAVALLGAGLPKGDKGMLIVLLVGGVVASALSMAGTLVTEFKISYWLGATPRKVQWSAIIASFLASALVTGTIMILASNPGYDSAKNPEALAAPQANLMASALQSFVGGGTVPWLMYGTGVAVAFLINMVGISPLAFGLGMYLPMELNAPILMGALVASFVNKSSKNEALVKGRSDTGILIASGLIAGAAILGVIKNLLASFGRTKPFIDGWGQYGENLLGSRTPEEMEMLTNWIGLGAFLGLCVLVYINCMMARPAKIEPGAPPAHGH